MIVIEARPRRERITAAIGAGARGYVAKDQDLTELAGAIQTVAAGGLAYARGLEAAAAGTDAPRLSPRELSVLRAYASGMTLDAAARHVGVRPATAKTYLARAKYAEERAERCTTGDAPELWRDSARQYRALAEHARKRAATGAKRRAAGKAAAATVTMPWALPPPRRRRGDRLREDRLDE